MGQIIETYEDGWDCVPELKRAVKQIEGIKPLIYEINNCVRDHDLDFLVDEMKEHLENAIDILDQIDTDVEFETVDEEDEEELLPHELDEEWARESC